MLKAFFQVGSATFLSRILGFIRDILIAAALGSGPVADAFFVAFRFPNLFRRIFAEGAFNSAFIPLFAGKLESDGHDAARRYGENIFATLSFILILLSILIEISMPLFMWLNAPGFKANPAQFELTILYSRVMFPFLACMSIMAMLSGMLNSKGKFALAAFAPSIMNMVLILILFLTLNFSSLSVSNIALLMSWGVLLAGVLQVILLIYAAHKQNFAFDFKFPRINHEFKELFKLAIPGIIAGGIVQINIFVGTIIASQSKGAVSYLYYADRLYQLPLGVIGIGMGVVILPILSRQFTAKNWKNVHHYLDKSIELAMAFTLPAAVALFLIPDELIKILFERGAFDENATNASADALKIFALGLPAFVLIKIFSSGYFAAKDTKTPMYFALISVFLNIIISLMLFSTLQHVAIAIATTVSGWCNALLLIFTIKKRIKYAQSRQSQLRAIRLLLAAGLMGCVIYILNNYILVSMKNSEIFFVQLAGMAILIIFSMITFLAFSFVTKAVSISEIKALRKNR